MARQKLPVFEVVGTAYGFVFRRAFSILRVAWFGMALIAAAGWAAATIAGLPGQVTSTPQDAEQLLVVIAPIAVIALFVLLMIQVGIAKVYFDLPRGRLPIYFSLDGVFWRVLGGLVVYGLIIMTWLLVVGEVLSLAPSVLGGVSLTDLQRGGSFGSSEVTPLAAAMMLALGLVFFVGTVFLEVRLLLFLPAAVSDGGIGLLHAWRATRGNVWRLVGAHLVAIIVLMMTVVGAVMLLIVLSYVLSRMLSMPLETFESLWVVNALSPVFFIVFYTLLMAFGVGLTCAIYEALTRPPSSEARSGEDEVGAVEAA